MGLLWLIQACCPASDFATRPNIIIILADDLGYGDLGMHGNPRLRTPRLDRLGTDSVRFTDHHVAPMCTPTRGELLTGCDAFRNGATAVADGRSIVRRDVPMLPEMLRAAGYATAYFGKWHLGDNHPFRPHDRGFELSIRGKGYGVSSLSDHWLNDAFGDYYWRNDELVQLKGYNTDAFFREAMDWIAAQSRPFFITSRPPRRTSRTTSRRTTPSLTRICPACCRRSTAWRLTSMKTSAACAAFWLSAAWSATPSSST
jgi:arylsulfatase